MHRTKIRWDQSLFVLLASFFFLFFLNSSVLASPEELAAVNQWIQNSGARWQAAETSISKLPSEQRRMRLGLVKGSFSLPQGAAAASTTSANGAPTKTPPATLNYNVPASGNTYGYVTPIRNQGNCGSCWAFAATAALESQYLMSTNGNGWPNLTPNVLYDGLVNGGLSEQILLSCSNAGNCEIGGWIDLASAYIQSTGLPLASCFLYTATDSQCSNASCPFWQSQTYSIKGWEYVPPQTAPTAAQLESYLDTYGPLVTTMNVYSDFYYYTRGIYSYTSGSYEGGHAIEIIGYNDTGSSATSYFIVKNSWGAGWGTTDPTTGAYVTTPGFFLIAFSQLNVQASRNDQLKYGANPYLFGCYSIAYTGFSPDLCTYSLSSSSASAPYSGGNASVSVTATTGCSWQAVSNVNWISIVSGASGKGNGTVTYSVSANNTTNPRNGGTLTIAGQTFTVNQAAATCGNSTISPTSANPAYTGGSATVNVTSPTGCSWTAAVTTGASWISITSGASGTGNGTVKYSVSANTSGASRQGSLTIAGQTLTVTQAAAPCTYSLSATSASPTYTGVSNATVNVTSISGCSWTAVSNNTSWISVVSGASGSGSGTVTYSVSANNANTSRQGTLTIAGKTFTVTQAAEPCTYSLSATSASPTYTGVNNATVNVTSISGCSWTAVSNASWISIVSGRSGTGSGTVTYSAAANNAGASRTGTLTIAGKTLTVTQGAAPCTYAISPQSASPTYTGGNASVSVTSPTGCPWTAVSNASWISVLSGASGTGNGTVTYSVSTNSSAASGIGTLTIAGQTFTVTRAGVPPCSYSLSSKSASPAFFGGNATVNVTSPTGCPWTVASNASWISIVSGKSGTGNGTVTYSVSMNTSFTSRTGTLTIGGQTFTVTQGGRFIF